MPITQSRMLSLLGAAQDYQRGLERLIELIAEQQFKLDNGQTTAGNAVASISMHANIISLLQRAIDSALVIKLESVHFAREGRRNAAKAAKQRENRKADAIGLPRPNRGDGRQISRAAARQINPIIRPDPSITAPGQDFVGEVELGADGLLVNGEHASLSWAERSIAARKAAGLEEITTDTELDFDLPADYVPQPISDEAKAKIAQWGAEQDAAREWTPQAGYAIAQALCKHAGALPGVACAACGKELAAAPPAGPSHAPDA